MGSYKLPFDFKMLVPTINRGFSITDKRAAELADKVNSELEEAFKDDKGITDIGICEMFCKHAENVQESYFMMYQAGRICEMFFQEKSTYAVKVSDVMSDGKVLPIASGGSC